MERAAETADGLPWDLLLAGLGGGLAILSLDERICVNCVIPAPSFGGLEQHKQLMSHCIDGPSGLEDSQRHHAVTCRYYPAALAASITCCKLLAAFISGCGTERPQDGYPPRRTPAVHHEGFQSGFLRAQTTTNFPTNMPLQG